MVKSQFPVRVTRETRVGAVFWILTLEFFMGEAIAETAWKGPPAYSLLSDAISDLGVTVCGIVKIGGVSGYYCSPLHNVMNASFILAGVFMLLGLYLTRAAFSWNTSMNVGAALFAIAGIGKITVGLNPANLNFMLHFLGALGIPLAGVGMIFIGRSIHKSAKWLGDLAQSLGFIGFIGFILFLFTSQSGIGGLMERIADYPMFAWMVVLGLLLIKSNGKLQMTELLKIKRQGILLWCGRLFLLFNPHL